MSKYGIPYKGNKSKIAKDILGALPPGKRLVDLFGGGFAITHCALVEFPNKWDSFMYNDHNHLLQPLIYDSIAGKYTEENFKPEWVSRDRFYAEKEKDGYIKWIWSFGNNGNDYLYGRDIEDFKKKAHEFIVFDIRSDITDGIELESTKMHDRRIEFCKKIKSKAEREGRCIHIERLQNLSQLASLQRLESLQRLDYTEYKYKPGDVVYCDIPYEDAINPKDYGGGFDHKKFYKWAKSQPYDIYLSSYTKGSVIWQKQVRSVMNSASGQVYRNEVLFKL